MSEVVLVTGATQGLGTVVVESFMEAGFLVALTGRDEPATKEVARQLDPTGEKVVPFQLDVLSKSDFENALAAVVDRFGRCDVLVNNAAMTPTTPVMDISAEEFDEVIAINLRGTFFGCQVFGQHFVNQKSGRIINMASLAGQMGGTASGAHYASTKGGILTLTKLFARQFADAKVTVNAIAPGPVDVPSVRDKVPAARLEEIINTMIPVKEMSDPKFIADMAVMLTRKDASTVTGACWDINGGIYMR